MDWLNLVGNAFWIFGCALALSALSHASWQASLSGRGWREAAGSGRTPLVLHLAGMLFCAGLALSAPRTWEAALWALLGLGVLFHYLYSRGKRRMLARVRPMAER